jgi:hypothetical protein
MTVRLAVDGTIELEGACPSEDAEPLLRLLLASPGATVDWQFCKEAHTAVVQVLAVAQPRLRGPPRGDFLREVVAPALTRRPGY